MKVVRKLTTTSNFYREIKLYVADLSSHITDESAHRQKHVEVVQNLLIFLDRLRSTIYQKSFDAVQDIIRLKLYKSSTSTEREIC